MDFSQESESLLNSSTTSNNKVVTPGEEYDPSHPLDSSDEEDVGDSCPVVFATSTTTATSDNNNVGVPSGEEGATLSDDKSTSNVNSAKGDDGIGSVVTLIKETGPAIISSSSGGETGKTGIGGNTSGGNNSGGILSNSNKEPEIDLSSIPMPSDEYRRPTIQFSIPTRHRLMSISSLIKRQKGVMKKQDKDGGSTICYNSEVSKAFNKGDGEDGAGEGEGGTDRPKVSLVQEIFGSDEEENVKEDQEDIAMQSPEDQGDLESNNKEQRNSQSSSGVTLEGGEVSLSSTGNELLSERCSTEITGGDDTNNRWKTLEKSVESDETVSASGVVACVAADSLEEDDNSQEEIRISIKPSSELLEEAGNENSSEAEEPEIIIEEDTVADVDGDNNDNSRKENNQIILECVSDEEPDFEVTYVGIKRSNPSSLRSKQGHARLPRKGTSVESPHRRRSSSPLNGFEEGEIVEISDRKKKKAKKKKSKKRKRSRDSRISSSRASERSTGGSPEKSKSFSENSDSKEVSWRKPKMAKARNYRYKLTLKCYCNRQVSN